MKKILKSNIVTKLLSFLLFLYLKICYLTSKKIIIHQDDKNNYDFTKIDKSFFLFWHNKLSLIPGYFKDLPNRHALTSSHKDGKLIANILQFFGIKIIYGSTNKNAFSAIKNIIKQINQNDINLGLTPDGPRGPIYKINSNVSAIAKLTKAKIILVGVAVSRKKIINSWDRFQFPLPFGKIIYNLSYIYDYNLLVEKVKADNNDNEQQQIDKFLESELIRLDNQAQEILNK